MPLKAIKEMGMYRAECIPDDEYTYLYLKTPHHVEQTTGGIFIRIDKKGKARFWTPVEGFSKEEYNMKDFQQKDAEVYYITEPFSMMLPSKDDHEAFRNN